MWDNLDLLTKISRYLPFVQICAIAVVGLGLHFLKLNIDHKIENLKGAREYQRKLTPPIIEAQLGISEKGNFYVVVDSKNDTPFKARWCVVTEKDIIVDGVMLEEVQCYPFKQNRHWQYKDHLDKNKVVNGYLELRFDYRSIYFEELGRPKELYGRTIHKYKLVNEVLESIK